MKNMTNAFRNIYLQEYFSASKDTITPIFIKCKNFMGTNPKPSHHRKSPLPSGYFKVNSVFIDCTVNLHCKKKQQIYKENNFSLICMFLSYLMSTNFTCYYMLLFYLISATFYLVYEVVTSTRLIFSFMPSLWLVLQM